MCLYQEASIRFNLSIPTSSPHQSHKRDLGRPVRGPYERRKRLEKRAIESRKDCRSVSGRNGRVEELKHTRKEGQRKGPRDVAVQANG